ncbi:MAG: sensor histidine kinase, partial [Dysgonomonas sp.]
QGNSLYMEVENSKSTQQIKKKDSSGLGLKNAKERLKILYPNKHKLQIKETEQIYIIQLNITL